MTVPRAYGLELDTDFEIPGVDETAGNGTPRRVRVEQAEQAELRGRLGSERRERIAEVTGPEGVPLATIDAVGDAGFAVWAKEFGDAWVDADGATVRCAPADLPAWRWQRFLTGQVLPFVAVLHGLEPLHASAVVLGGRALAVVAAGGAGKTSLALELALEGLPFLDDDVLVLEPDGGGVLAHPGPGVANVRRDESGLVDRIRHAGLGDALGATADETRMAVRRHDRAVPLGALFFLGRAASGERAEIERLSPVEPRLLLAATFNLALLTPARLTRQLEVCGAVADSAAVFRVSCPPAVDAHSLAGELRDAVLGLGPVRP